MNFIIRTVFCVSVVAISLGCGEKQSVIEDKPFQAGAASNPVSPAAGAFIAGDKKNRQFTGVHDDIYVKASVFSDGDKALAIVVIDCIGMLHTDIQKIRARAAELITQIELPAQHIMISSTHTHSGPDVVGIWGPDQMTTGKDPAYMTTLIESAAQTIKKAADRLQPVTARYGTSETGEAWVENICEPELLDRTVSTIQFRNDADETIVTLTNFACHPTIMDAQSSEVSSDYVAGFYRKMGETLQGEHLFLQGAIGGWIQPKKIERTFKAADARGVSVADAALAALEKGTDFNHYDIALASQKLTLPLANEGFKTLAQIGVLDKSFGETVESEVAWFKIGPAQFATHPGETSPMYSHQTRELMSGDVEMVMGLGLDALGYILKPEYFGEQQFPHAEYLCGMSTGPETGPRMMEGLTGIIPVAGE